eukprot:gene858-299_t
MSDDFTVEILVHKLSIHRPRSLLLDTPHHCAALALSLTDCPPVVLDAVPRQIESKSLQDVNDLVTEEVNTAEGFFCFDKFDEFTHYSQWVLDFGGHGKALTFKKSKDGSCALRISVIARMSSLIERTYTNEEQQQEDGSQSSYTGQAFVMASGCLDLSDEILTASRECPYRRLKLPLTACRDGMSSAAQLDAHFRVRVAPGQPSVESGIQVATQVAEEVRVDVPVEEQLEEEDEHHETHDPEITISPRKNVESPRMYNGNSSVELPYVGDEEKPLAVMHDAVPANQGSLSLGTPVFTPPPLFYNRALDPDPESSPVPAPAHPNNGTITFDTQTKENGLKEYVVPSRSKRNPPTSTLGAGMIAATSVNVKLPERPTGPSGKDKLKKVRNDLILGASNTRKGGSQNGSRIPGATRTIGRRPLPTSTRGSGISSTAVPKRKPAQSAGMAAARKASNDILNI